MRHEEVSDFGHWRKVGRRLLGLGVAPEHVHFVDVDEAQRPLFHDHDAPPSGQNLTSSVEEPAVRYAVPSNFLRLAQIVGYHRDGRRWDTLYRVLYRLTHGEPELLDLGGDPDIRRLDILRAEVRTDEHHMHAFVRFHRVRGSDAEPERFAAYYQPDHRILRLAAPFFARRFAALRWSIFTPDDSVMWTGDALVYGPGVPRSEAAGKVDKDEFDDLFRTYWENVFNPARLNVKVMQSLMPQRHWRGMPEVISVSSLVRHAFETTRSMSREAPSASTAYVPDSHSLTVVAEAARACTACDLYARATQVVFGEGPRHAHLMFVGEQPGDQEDRAGKPFVGPAGVVFDAGLERVGIARADVYVTNAVKHFKWEPRGKRRIHSKPNSKEIVACRAWLTKEIELVKPRMIVALGATAAQSFMGAKFSITRSRGEVFETKWAPFWMATYHPSALLRMPDEDARLRAQTAFDADLARVAEAYRRLGEPE